MAAAGEPAAAGGGCVMRTGKLSRRRLAHCCGGPAVLPHRSTHSLLLRRGTAASSLCVARARPGLRRPAVPLLEPQRQLRWQLRRPASRAVVPSALACPYSLANSSALHVRHTRGMSDGAGRQGMGWAAQRRRRTRQGRQRWWRQRQRRGSWRLPAPHPTGSGTETHGSGRGREPVQATAADKHPSSQDCGVFTLRSGCQLRWGASWGFGGCPGTLGRGVVQNHLRRNSTSVIKQQHLAEGDADGLCGPGILQIEGGSWYHTCCVTCRRCLGNLALISQPGSGTGKPHVTSMGQWVP